MRIAKMECVYVLSSSAAMCVVRKEMFAVMAYVVRLRVETESAV